MPRPAPGDASQPAEAADTATEQQQAAEASQPAAEDDIQAVQGRQAGARTRSRKAAAGRAAEPSKPASPAVDEEVAGKRPLLLHLKRARGLQQQQAQCPTLIESPHPDQLKGGPASVRVVYIDLQGGRSVLAASVPRCSHTG